MTAADGTGTTTADTPAKANGGTKGCPALQGLGAIPYSSRSASYSLRSSVSFAKWSFRVFRLFWAPTA